MKLIYDPDTDMLYIDLVPRSGMDVVQIVDGVVADVDEQGVVGIEIEDASGKVDLSRLDLSGLSFDSLAYQKRVG